MSTELAVRLFLSAYEDDVAEGAMIVGDIHATDPSGQSRRGIVIPCGSRPEPKMYKVPPGRYVVSATLPSGLVLTEEVEAVADETTPVILDLTDSPYESHSWQYLMGNIELGRVYHDTAEMAPAISPGSRSMAAPPPGPDGVIPESTADRTVTATWIDAPLSSWTFPALLAAAEDESDFPLAELMARTPPVVLTPDVLNDPLSPLYRIDHKGPVGAPDSGPRGRQFLAVEVAGSLRLVTLPLPWGDAQAEVLVNARQSPTGSAVAVTVRDPLHGAALAYMAQGALTTAAALFDDMEPLFHDRSHPLAAVAGAYVLLGTDHRDGERDWDPWLERLAVQAPAWLSDAAVLRAVRLLRLSRSADDRAGAREALVAAFDRGVPFYTLGLTWLIDALAAFPDDEECVSRLDRARRLSWLADTREPFLILDLGEGRA
ncbi:hypothetical protein [Streptomyces purpureus]|uniref:Uncharacterized protein n=1 Tax=Streptomyces purpureus TaxID=1951 RepID=A0A918GVU1_9ACTN|nr:hypothetical protein [Streptomyces purpureus]GGT12675.1 hypothetical protein GCM10014713_01360 [Streptomyces purpureus]